MGPPWAKEVAKENRTSTAHTGNQPDCVAGVVAQRDRSPRAWFYPSSAFHIYPPEP